MTSKAQTKVSAAPAGTGSKKSNKDNFDINEIIRCFDKCLSSKPAALPERAGGRSFTAEASQTAANRSDHIIIKSASVAAATKTITAAAQALSQLPSPKTNRRHIHRRSIIGSQDDSFHSPAASFHRRRSSIKVVLNKVFQPNIPAKLSSELCTVPTCKKKHTPHSTGSVTLRSPLPHVASLPNQQKMFVYITPYLDGFRELCKLLRTFGSTMSFAVDNLMETLSVLDYHIKSDRGNHYEHVEMMIKYETTYKLVQRKISGRNSGTKSILMLHRSQSFLIEFIRGLKNANSKSKSSAIAQQAFDNSIAKYYSWLVTSMASMAFSSLPPVNDCWSKISQGSAKEAVSLLKKMLESITPVYNRVQDIYGKHRQLKCV